MRASLILLLSALAFGCRAPVERVAPVAAELLMAGDLAASLEVGIEARQVRLVLNLTNVSGAPIPFTFPTSQRYDFRVEAVDGEVIWRWSDDRMFAQVITESELAASESWTMEATWPSGERAGRYVAVGQLTSMDGGLEQRAAFDLP